MDSSTAVPLTSAVAAVLTDDAGRVLLCQQSSGHRLWSLPGGRIRQAESPMHAAVRDIRVAPHGEATRVVLDLNRRVSFRHLTLDQPPRLAIDLPEVGWDVPRINGARVVGLIKGLRFGRFRPGVSRIVLDVAQPFEVQRVFELPPSGGHGHRIVTDLVAARVPAVSAAAPAAAVEQRQAALAVIPPPPKKEPPPARRTYRSGGSRSA